MPSGRGARGHPSASAPICVRSTAPWDEEDGSGPGSHVTAGPGDVRVRPPRRAGGRGTEVSATPREAGFAL